MPEPTASSASANITVAGTDAEGQTVSASGYVAGVIEDGGVCTFRFSSGDVQFESTTTGLANVSTTSCGLVSRPLSDFDGGAAWTVVLDYTSAAVGEAVSPALNVELP